MVNKHNKPGDLGNAALIGHSYVFFRTHFITSYIWLLVNSADEVNKAGAYLRDYMTNPTECMSVDMAHTPFQMAFKPEGNLFTWYGEPANAGRLSRFNAAMKGSLNASPMNILKGKSFSNTSICVLVLTILSFRLEFGH
jgi:hypothetical protein